MIWELLKLVSPNCGADVDLIEKALLSDTPLLLSFATPDKYVVLLTYVVEKVTVNISVNVPV